MKIKRRIAAVIAISVVIFITILTFTLSNHKDTLSDTGTRIPMTNLAERGSEEETKIIKAIEKNCDRNNYLWIVPGKRTSDKHKGSVIKIGSIYQKDTDASTFTYTQGKGNQVCAIVWTDVNNKLGYSKDLIKNDAILYAPDSNVASITIYEK